MSTGDPELVPVAQLRELLAKATPGEWRCHDGPDDYEHRVAVELSPYAEDLVCDVWSTPDAALIAAAVNALPALLDELDALRTTIADHARIVADVQAQADRFCDKYLAALKRAEAAESELAALRARVEAAPVVVIGNADAYSCWLEKWQGSESGPVHAMKGQRARLLAAPAGGEG